MKYIYLLVAGLSMAAMLQACALIGEPIAQEVSKVVIKYCEEPSTARGAYGQTINAKLVPYGHQLHVHCAGDSTD